MEFDDLSLDLDASDVDGINDELDEAVALEVASLFDSLLGEGEGLGVDGLLGIGGRFDLFLALDISIDVDHAILLVLTDSLAQRLEGILLRVGGGDSFFNGLGEGLEHLCLGSLFQFISRDICNKGVAVVVTGSLVAYEGGEGSLGRIIVPMEGNASPAISFISCRMMSDSLMLPIEGSEQEAIRDPKDGDKDRNDEEVIGGGFHRNNNLLGITGKDKNKMRYEAAANFQGNFRKI